jgi:hypothetical protein
MPTVSEIQAWMADRDRQDDRLYVRYGRPLEAEHTGEFVAISDAGQVILGTDELLLTEEAVARFGSGNFALRKIGAAAEGRVLAVAP